MKVQILLSTFNGEQYLSPQIESLLKQDYPTFEILIRDDGSRDSTVALAKQLTEQHAQIKLISGNNIGLVQSFFKLLELSDQTADYFSFCDQDDVWLSNKLSRAVAYLNKISPEIPTLYCTRLTVVNNELKLLDYTKLPIKKLSFHNALVEGMTWGCTIVINRAARNLILRELPQQAYLHDWWFYLVVSAFGQIYYDKESAILYRRHQFNASQFQASTLMAWRVMFERFLKHGKQQLVVKQVQEFQRIFGKLLDPQQKAILNDFLDSRNALTSRIRYAINGSAYRQSRRDNLIMKCLSVIKRL